MSYHSDNIWVALCSQWPRELMPLEGRIARDIIDKVLDTPAAPRRRGDTADATKIPPTLEMVRAYFIGIGSDLDAETFFDHYESNGWMVGKSKMKNWQAAARRADKYWERRRGGFTKPKASFMA